jgi:hypothetical protein
MEDAAWMKFRDPPQTGIEGDGGLGSRKPELRNRESERAFRGLC